MNEEIRVLIDSIVNALGGESKEILDEFTKFRTEYPHLTMIIVAMVAEQRHHCETIGNHEEKLELLKDAVVDSGCAELAAMNRKGVDKSMIN